jgi:DNA repair ATPase RecN
MVTRTHLQKLQGEGRVTSIAKMLSGSTLGPAALAHAQSLLDVQIQVAPDLTKSETPVDSE